MLRYVQVTTDHMSSPTVLVGAGEGGAVGSMVGSCFKILKYRSAQSANT